MSAKKSPRLAARAAKSPPFDKGDSPAAQRDLRLTAMYAFPHQGKEILAQAHGKGVKTLPFPKTQ